MVRYECTYGNKTPTSDWIGPETMQSYPPEPCSQLFESHDFICYSSLCISFEIWWYLPLSMWHEKPSTSTTTTMYRHHCQVSATSCHYVDFLNCTLNNVVNYKRLALLRHILTRYPFFFLFYLLKGRSYIQILFNYCQLCLFMFVVKAGEKVLRLFVCEQLIRYCVKRKSSSWHTNCHNSLQQHLIKENSCVRR